MSLSLRAIALLLVVLMSACGGCDVLDPATYIDAAQFVPDVNIAQPDGGESDMDAGGSDDTGRNPVDTDFVFDFGNQPDVGEQPFALEAVVPDFGPVAGGTQVRITGTGLSEESVVYVGASQMSTQLAGGALVGRVPPAAGPGLSTVKVVAPDGEIRVLVDAFEYVDTLRIDAVEPFRVPTTGGVEVNVYGAGFSPQVGVSISTDPALRVTFVDSSTLRVLTPPRPKGLADLRVTTPTESVEAEDAIQYFEPLRIDAVEPASGSTLGGDTVTVRGAGFTSTTTLTLGGVSAAISQVDTAAGTITATTPPHPSGAVEVAVHTSIDSAAIANGFYYRVDATPVLIGVQPAFGPVSGGNTVRVNGYGFDAPGTQIRIGGAPATLVAAQPSFADVVAPAGAAGFADVSLHDGLGTQLDALVGAYQYVTDLGADGATPTSGPDSGGTTVTVMGTGFTGVETVLVGGVPAEFSVTDDGTLIVVTPQHTAGTVDIEIQRDGLSATLPDAFTYTGTLQVWGFSPTRGAIAGGTYVEVRGRGFFGLLDVTLGGVEGLQVQRIDRNNLRFFTPPNEAGEAELQVQVDALSATGPYTYLYFDPASRFGGASGSEVDGAVNVTVFADGGGPIENAFVMLSTRADTPYQGWTNALGQVTLSGPDVVGAQTTTATAAGYSTATMQTVDSENITLFLTKLDPASGSGTIDPPPFGTIHGIIKATGKLSDPDDANTYDMAVVGTTTKAAFGANPPAGPNAIVIGDGRYEITTRVGDMAVVGLCGTYDQTTGQFTPQLMAVRRFVFIADKDELEIDLLCDIPLDQTQVYKLVNAPFAPTGPDNNIVTVVWDFGFEGFFESPTFGRGFDSLVEVPGQPAPVDVLADITFTAVGGAYTGFGSPPSSQSIRPNIAEVDDVVTMPVLLDVPELMHPQPGGVIGDAGIIRLQASGPYQPDFSYIVLRNDMGIPVWTIFLPGNEVEAKLPEFPDFSAVPVENRPFPMSSGLLFMTVVSTRIDGGHVYENFDYRDIDPDLWEAYAVASWPIRLK